MIKKLKPHTEIRGALDQVMPHVGQVEEEGGSHTYGPGSSSAPQIGTIIGAVGSFFGGLFGLNALENQNAGLGNQPQQSQATTGDMTNQGQSNDITTNQNYFLPTVTNSPWEWPYPEPPFVPPPEITVDIPPGQQPTWPGPIPDPTNRPWPNPVPAPPLPVLLPRPTPPGGWPEPQPLPVDRLPLPNREFKTCYLNLLHNEEICPQNEHEASPQKGSGIHTWNYPQKRRFSKVPTSRKTATNSRYSRHKQRTGYSNRNRYAKRHEDTGIWSTIGIP